MAPDKPESVARKKSFSFAFAPVLWAILASKRRDEIDAGIRARQPAESRRQLSICREGGSHAERQESTAKWAGFNRRGGPGPLGVESLSAAPSPQMPV